MTSKQWFRVGAVLGLIGWGLRLFLPDTLVVLMLWGSLVLFCAAIVCLAWGGVQLVRERRANAGE